MVWALRRARQHPGHRPDRRTSRAGSSAQTRRPVTAPDRRPHEPSSRLPQSRSVQSPAVSQSIAFDILFSNGAGRPAAAAVRPEPAPVPTIASPQNLAETPPSLCDGVSMDFFPEEGVLGMRAAICQTLPHGASASAQTFRTVHGRRTRHLGSGHAPGGALCRDSSTRPALLMIREGEVVSPSLDLRPELGSRVEASSAHATKAITWDASTRRRG